jgi:hypothetical protein
VASRELSDILNTNHFTNRNPVEVEGTMAKVLELQGR